MGDVAHMPNGINPRFNGLSSALFLLEGILPVFLTVCASGVEPIVPLQEVTPHLVSKACAQCPPSLQAVVHSPLYCLWSFVLLPGELCLFDVECLYGRKWGAATRRSVSV